VKVAAEQVTSAYEAGKVARQTPADGSQAAEGDTVTLTLSKGPEMLTHFTIGAAGNINHHYLMRFATAVTPRPMWFNFAHLFSVSLLPLSTAWMAVSELGAQPVAFYAAVFFLVNLTYILLIRELIDRATVRRVSAKMRRSMHARSIATLCLFGAAAVIARRYPLLGLAVCCCCLIAYLKPNAPGLGTRA